MNKKQIIISTLLLVHGAAHAVPLVNLSDAKKRVQKYYETGDYDRDLEKIVARAKRKFKKIKFQNNATVIFDIDDTILSDYGDTKSISFGYIPKLYHEWVLEADAPAIPQVKELYDYLVERGFTIVFLTGRKYNEYDATIQNLKREGFTKFDRLIVRQPHELKLSAREYKTARRKKLEQAGYNIVGAIGDQTSDLVGGYTGIRIKVPNYIYAID